MTRANPPPEEKTMYRPTDDDKEWARKVLQLIKEEGGLALPDAGLAYSVSHIHKRLTLVNPEKLIEYDSMLVHLQTMATFESIGYTVETLDDITRAAMNFEHHTLTCSVCSRATRETCEDGEALLKVFYDALVAQKLQDWKGGTPQ